MPDDPGAAAFRDLLQPCALEDFLGGPYGRHPWHGRAGPGAGRSIMGWRELNHALGITRAWDERTLRLALRGRPVPAADYCVRHEGAAGPVWRPSAERVTAALHAGATLVASGIDGVIPSVGHVAEAIERALPVRVQVNLYLSAAGVAGFPRHEDSHDVLVLHLAGRKRWTAHAPGRPAGPADQGAADRASDGAPDGAALGFTLEPGDLLYLPQGWAHEALAEREGCLHLSFALVHLTLADIARALLQQVGADDAMARPLHDLHGGPQAMAGHVDDILRRLQALRAEGDSAASLWHGLLASRRARARYALPGSAGAGREMPPTPGDPSP